MGYIISVTIAAVFLIAGFNIGFLTAKPLADLAVYNAEDHYVSLNKGWIDQGKPEVISMGEVRLTPDGSLLFTNWFIRLHDVTQITGKQMAEMYCDEIKRRANLPEFQFQFGEDD